MLQSVYLNIAICFCAEDIELECEAGSMYLTLVCYLSVSMYPYHKIALFDLFKHIIVMKAISMVHLVEW